MQVPESPEDDWFSEPDVRPSPGRVGQPVEDDEWLEGDDLRPRSAPPFDLRTLADRRLLVVAGFLIAFLLAVLAAAGVFSGSARRPTTPISTGTAPPATPPTAAPAATAPQTTLKPGNTGAQVKVLQQALANLGYSAGAADGQYGPTTKRAVAAFQHARGLTADGIFGPKTLQALARALGR